MLFGVVAPLVPYFDSKSVYLFLYICMYVTLPITKDYAREMIGQMVYVKWPYLTEAYLRLQDKVSNSSWFVKCFRMALLAGHMSEHNILLQ